MSRNFLGLCPPSESAGDCRILSFSSSKAADPCRRLAHVTSGETAYLYGKSFPYVGGHFNMLLVSTQLILIAIYRRMLAQNVVNSEKQGKIVGHVFHLFYPDLNTAVLYDAEIMKPIIWGSKTIVIGVLKTIHEEMRVKDETKITVYSYILGTEGFRRIQTYSGPINTVGKYLMRY